MKLDSIVYDYGTLQSAIVNTLNSESPTFQAIYPSDTATSLTNVLAAYGSMLQYQLVSAMANMYTDSAYSEAGIYQLAETLGNRLHGNISSQIYCNITRTNLKGVNVVIPAGSRFVVEDLNFFNPEAITFPISSNTVPKVKLIQGILLRSEQVTSGISGEKIYFCDDFKCNTNLVKVYVNGVQWDITDSFLPYVVTDDSVANRAYAVILKTDPDGRTYIKFGNNTNGRIPEKGSNVTIEYISNEGANGNLNNNNLEINLSTPIYYTNTSNTRERLEVDITAISTASGGFDTQSLEVLKESSPYVFGSGQRAVRRNDYKAMLLNKCGYLTCNVWGEYEEAAIQGGYDKIMMNMVYYTGIKSIQKYDLQPVKTLDIDIANIAAKKYALKVELYDYAGHYVQSLPKNPEADPNPVLTTNVDQALQFSTREEANAFITTNNLEYVYDETKTSPIVPVWLTNVDSHFYNVSGSISGARGFLGSYVVDIASYDIDNSVVSVKYRDRQGTGILTCDPSINSVLKDFEKDVFPVNDLKVDEGVKITLNQATNGAPITEILISEKTEDDDDYITSGKTFNDQPFVITFDNPLQVRFEFPERTKVGAFAFKTPKSAENYGKFMHQFAIYGTNKTINSATPGESEPDYTNIKNNSDWDKLSGMQTFDTELGLNNYSDWITTNIYNPDQSTEEEENVTATNTVIGNVSTFTIRDLVSDDYSYVIRVNGETAPTNTYTISRYDPTNPIRTITFNKIIEPDIPVVVYGTSYDWTKYKYYVIEIYTIHDSLIKSPQKVAFRQIKALYKDSLSTIDYSNNNAINLNIPIAYSDPSNTSNETKRLCLPNNMQYYEYKVTLNNLNEGYRTGDILRWSNTIDGIVYTFEIDIVNLAASLFNIRLKTSENEVFSSNLRGKSNITVNNDTLDAATSLTHGSGGTITITSTSTVNVYGSYTGNFYTNSDIQSADLPTLNKYNHFTTYIEFKQPLIKNVVIEANVEYENVTNYQTVRNNVITAINELFDLKPFSIGSSLNVSDIWKAINSVEGVRRFTVVTPVSDINCLPYELLMLPAENLTINDIINSEYK